MEAIRVKLMEAEGMEGIKVLIAKIIKAKEQEMLVTGALTMVDLGSTETTLMENQLWINIKMNKKTIKKDKPLQ